tara:strand:- start:314 stop:1564 length:1251 start_codon:yes stop_codon:yes gene_type:complete
MTKHQIIVKRDLAKAKQKYKSWYVDLSRTSIKITGGKKGQTKFYFHTKQEANHFAISMNTDQVEGGVTLRHPEKSIGSVMNDFIDRTNNRYDDRAIVEKHRSNLITDTHTWKSLIFDKADSKHVGKKFADMLCEDIDSDMIDLLIRQIVKQFKPKTLSNKIVTLTTIFELAIKKGYCRTNPVKDIEYEPAVYLGEDEAEKNKLADINLKHIRQLIEKSDRFSGSQGLAIAFACQTGLRFGEQAALKWKHIDLENNYVYVRVSLRKEKGGAYAADIPKMTKRKKINKLRRKIFIPHDLQMRLKKWNVNSAFSRDEDYVFSTRLGTPQQTADNWRKRVLHPLCDEIDGQPRLRWHDLRHVYASICLKLYGENFLKIADLMGHQDINTTRDNYGHTISDIEEDAVDADKFNQTLWQQSS